MGFHVKQFLGFLAFSLCIFTTVYAGNPLGFGAGYRQMPPNVRLDTGSVFVKDGDTKYTRAFMLAGRGAKFGVIVIQDTNAASTQHGLTFGFGDTAGVKITQQVGYHFGTTFGSAKGCDTIWTTIGDTVEGTFKNKNGISFDSLICASMDTSNMSLKAIGTEDSAWVSKAYFIPDTDLCPLTRFKVFGNTGLGTTAYKIIVGIFSEEGSPVYLDR